MSNFNINKYVSLWHIFFFSLIIIFAALAVHRRKITADQVDRLFPAAASEEPQKADETDDYAGERSDETFEDISAEDILQADDTTEQQSSDYENQFVRRSANDSTGILKRSTPIEQQQYFEIDLNHLYYMKPHLTDAEIAEIVRDKSDENSLNGSATMTAGQFYSARFVDYEVNFTRLDRNTLARVETRRIVDAMTRADPRVYVKLMRLAHWEARSRDAEARSGEMRRRRQRGTDAFQLCLAERNTVCNRHLPVAQQCTCHTVPHFEARLSAPLCDELYSIVHPARRVLTYAVLFPVPEILQILPDAFFAHFLNYYAKFVGNASRVVILRRNCVSERVFAFQVAFLKQSSSNGSVGTAPRYRDDDFDEFHLDAMESERAWLTQAVFNRLPFPQFDQLMPTRVAEARWYREWIAQAPPKDCGGGVPWDYMRYVRCRWHEPLYLAVAAFWLGVVGGTLRFYSHAERISERKQLAVVVSADDNRLNNAVEEERDVLLL